MQETSSSTEDRNLPGAWRRVVAPATRPRGRSNRLFPIPRWPGNGYSVARCAGSAAPIGLMDTSYDLCLAWNWEHDAAFVRLLDEACRARGVSLWQIPTGQSLGSAIDQLNRGEARFRLLLDRASEEDSRFVPLADWVRGSGAQSVNPFELTRRAVDKATMHRAIFASIRTPYTIILPAQRAVPELPAVDCTPVGGQGFTVKPARGGGGVGAMIAADTLEQVAQARKQFPDDEHLLTARVIPAILDHRRGLSARSTPARFSAAGLLERQPSLPPGDHRRELHYHPSSTCGGSPGRWRGPAPGLQLFFARNCLHRGGVPRRGLRRRSHRPASAIAHPGGRARRDRALHRRESGLAGHERAKGAKDMNFLELAAQRYSVRSYKPDAVEPDKLARALEAARLAPTGLQYPAFCPAGHPHGGPGGGAAPDSHHCPGFRRRRW